MSGDSQVLPPGWHVDEDTGALKPAEFRIVESVRLDADEKLNIE